MHPLMRFKLLVIAWRYIHLIEFLSEQQRAAMIIAAASWLDDSDPSIPSIPAEEILACLPPTSVEELARNLMNRLVKRLSSLKVKPTTSTTTPPMGLFETVYSYAEYDHTRELFAPIDSLRGHAQERHVAERRFFTTTYLRDLQNECIDWNAELQLCIDESNPFRTLPDIASSLHHIIHAKLIVQELREQAICAATNENDPIRLAEFNKVLDQSLKLMWPSLESVLGDLQTTLEADMARISAPSSFPSSFPHLSSDPIPSFSAPSVSDPSTSTSTFPEPHRPEHLFCLQEEFNYDQIVIAIAIQFGKLDNFISETMEKKVNAAIHRYKRYLDHDMASLQHGSDPSTI